MSEERSYIAIDLKSFYASVECRDRGLDPLRTNLVVADVTRTEKTICLAVSPSLKGFGIAGRARLFEVVSAVAKVNAARRHAIAGKAFLGSSVDAVELEERPELELDYIVAPPQMQRYEEISAAIYQIYLQYVAPEDIHSYSIDEVFMDVTHYLKTYQLTAHALTVKIIRHVLRETGITATAGIAPNMYLCKIAMDIVAKHVPADADGVRIAELDVPSYRRSLWDHRPLTDFWRIGPGIARRLAALGVHTQGELARLSLEDEDLLFQEFGVNAEYLIDHAWGIEPVTIADYQAYRPKKQSIGIGQVLQEPTENRVARILLLEMCDNLVLDLIEHGLLTNQLVLDISYDRLNLDDLNLAKQYQGERVRDRYGRALPKPAHGSIRLPHYSSSFRLIRQNLGELFDQITDTRLYIRKLSLAFGDLRREGEEPKESFEQLSLFSDQSQKEAEEERKRSEEKEKRAQLAALQLKKRFGKNAVLRGVDLQEEANARERNGQIGGHKA